MKVRRSIKAKTSMKAAYGVITHTIHVSICATMEYKLYTGHLVRQIEVYNTT
jgi:hypothetical protein